jgi:hypothetical protein
MKKWSVRFTGGGEIIIEAETNIEADEKFHDLDPEYIAAHARWLEFEPGDELPYEFKGTTPRWH